MVVIRVARPCHINHVEARMVERIDRRMERSGGVGGWERRGQMDPRVKRVLEKWGKLAKVPTCSAS